MLVHAISGPSPTILDDLPLFPLNLVLLPGELQPLHIFEPRYQELAARCESGDEPFVVVLADADGLHDVGCTAVVCEVLERFPDGRSNVLVRGGDPIRIDDVFDVRAYHTARGELLADDPAEADDTLQARALAAYAHLVSDTSSSAGPEPPGPGARLSYALAGRIDFDVATKQGLIENRDEVDRLTTVTDLIERLRRGLSISAEVEARARRNGRVRTPEEIGEMLGL